jgi:IclR family KDG regulon transcriptional repressor
MVSTKRSKYYVPAVAKTIAILEALAASDNPVTLQSLTEHTGLPKSSVYAILATLEMHQYVERDAANTYRLGLKALQIGAAATQTANVSQLFHEAARRIVKACGETAQLTILDQTEVIYVAREDGTQPVQLASNIGGRLPAYATASGKTLLAALPTESLDQLFAGRSLPTLTARTINSLSQLKQELRRIREVGYAHDNQETSDGLECVAAPIFDRNGQVVASISASFLSARSNPEHFQRVLQLVKTAAYEISTHMGWRAADVSRQPSPLVGSPANFVAVDTR